MSTLFLPPYLSLEFADDLVATLTEELELYGTEATKARALYEIGYPLLAYQRVLSHIFGSSHGLVHSMAHSESIHYLTVSLRKRSGGWRRIEAPR